VSRVLIRMLTAAATMPFLSSLSCQPAGRITSTYTELSGPRCIDVKADRETGSSVRQCPGAGGMFLFVLDDDNRMSVTVVTPDKKEHPLNYWDVVTRSFSSLGEKAEWRISSQNGAPTPMALIVRVNYSDQSDPEKPRKGSYLAVAKITPDAVCVVGRVPAGANANERAREEADRSASKPCLK
jgi:hypothetical protein